MRLNVRLLLCGAVPLALLLLLLLLLQPALANFWRSDDADRPDYAQRHDRYDKGDSWFSSPPSRSRFRSSDENHPSYSSAWWLMLPVGLLAVGGLLLTVTLLGIAAWVWHEWKQMVGYLSVGRFVLVVLKRLWHGESPLPPRHGAAASAEAAAAERDLPDSVERLRDIALPVGSYLYDFARRVGLNKVEELVRKYGGGEDVSGSGTHELRREHFAAEPRAERDLATERVKAL